MAERPPLSEKTLSMFPRTADSGLKLKKAVSQGDYASAHKIIRFAGPERKFPDYPSLDPNFNEVTRYYNSAVSEARQKFGDIILKDSDDEEEEEDLGIPDVTDPNLAYNEAMELAHASRGLDMAIRDNDREKARKIFDEHGERPLNCWILAGSYEKLVDDCYNSYYRAAAEAKNKFGF